MDHMNYQFGPILRVPRRLRGKFRRRLKDAYLRSGEVLDTLKTVRHPNLMSVYDYDDEYVYVEYVDGLVLSNRGHNCPAHHTRSYLDVAAGIDLSPIRDALAHLHANGVCHTDVTSHNVMVTRDGILKLIDLTCCLPRRRTYVRRDNRMFAELEREIRAALHTPALERADPVRSPRQRSELSSR